MSKRLDQTYPRPDQGRAGGEVEVFDVAGKDL